ncbi:MAG: hypothetical protein IKE22_04350, partial [Atopobiaceae bacterium]|nr:hypothetical protein [Atopobiaceae bacterium]
MAQLIDIRKVEIGPKHLTARVRVAMAAPLMTSDDLEGTTRVYRLLPHIIEHVCLGDGGQTFKDVMGDTEIAHLLEHVTVEILAQSDIAGDVPCGRTYEVEGERRTYDIEFPCPDDVLVIGALSSAVWILQWAYTGGGEPAPDVDATVRGLVELVQSLPEPEPPAPSIDEYVVEGEDARAILAEMRENEEAMAQEKAKMAESFEPPAWMTGVMEPVPEPEPAPAPAPEPIYDSVYLDDLDEPFEDEIGFVVSDEFAPEPMVMAEPEPEPE